MAVEKEEKVVYIATHAGEDPERASLPFILGNAALAMDMKAVVALQANGVYLAKKGYVDNVFTHAHPPLKELVQSFLELGGKILVCAPCIEERQISADELIEGAQVMAGATLTSELMSASIMLTY